MGIDRSEGWNAVADEFIAARSAIGAAFVRSWARESLPASGEVVDVGCGSGAPVAQALIDDGFTVFGIDASPTLIDAFRARLPNAQAVCEAAQESRFFNRTFDGALSIGLLFLLSDGDQRRVIHNIAHVLKPGGRFLFSTPAQPCEWNDSLTGRLSRSLGRTEYARCLEACGLSLVASRLDEGGNNYFDAIKPATTARQDRRDTSE